MGSWQSGQMPKPTVAFPVTLPHALNAVGSPLTPVLPCSLLCPNARLSVCLQITPSPQHQRGFSLAPFCWGIHTRALAGHQYHGNAAAHQFSCQTPMTTARDLAQQHRGTTNKVGRAKNKQADERDNTEPQVHEETHMRGQTKII